MKPTLTLKSTVETSTAAKSTASDQNLSEEENKTELSTPNKDTSIRISPSWTNKNKSAPNSPSLLDSPVDPSPTASPTIAQVPFDGTIPAIILEIKQQEYREIIDFIENIHSTPAMEDRLMALPHTERQNFTTVQDILRKTLVELVNEDARMWHNECNIKVTFQHIG
jgi:hypothetical protein